MSRFVVFVVLLVLGGIGWGGCGSDATPAAEKATKSRATKQISQESNQSATENTGGLSEFELKHGIGPIKKKLTLGKIDSKLVGKGKKIFELKCSACHELDSRRVGPPLRDVLGHRTPEFVMNMMLNPDEMIKRHPEVKKLLAEYLTVMTFQNLSVEDARAVLEYLRWAHQQGKK